MRGAGMQSGSAGPGGALVVFGRLPRPGRVKSRLARDLGESLACRLYAWLLERTLAAGEACSAVGRRHFHYDAADDGAFGDWLDALARRGWKPDVQHGAGLGERMRSSLDHALATAPAVVLVGTDGARLDAAYLHEAFDALRRHDCVLGPTCDGGYLLIGTRRPLGPAVFAQAWSSPAVLDGTRAALAGAGLSWQELPVTNDVDTIADLADLAGPGNPADPAEPGDAGELMPDSIAAELRLRGFR